MFRITKIIPALLLVLIVLNGLLLTKGYCDEGRYFKVLKDQKYSYYLDTTNMRATVSKDKKWASFNCWIKAKATDEGIKYRIQTKQKNGFKIKEYRNFDYISMHVIISVNLQNYDIVPQLLEVADYSQDEDILDYASFPFRGEEADFDSADFSSTFYCATLNCVTYALDKHMF
ncbi:MAG: hypothetical protein H6Q74_2460 [Firmicutes bacterium]|nr:hypothetical protein [Bacillota bacterium]